MYVHDYCLKEDKYFDNKISNKLFSRFIFLLCSCTELIYSYSVYTIICDWIYKNLSKSQFEKCQFEVLNPLWLSSVRVQPHQIYNYLTRVVIS